MVPSGLPPHQSGRTGSPSSVPASRPEPQPEQTSASRNRPATGTTISRRTIKPLASVRQTLARLLGYAIATKYLQAQDWVSTTLGKIRKGEKNGPPCQSSRGLVLALARENNPIIKTLYEGRLIELQKKYRHYPVIHFFTKGVLWTRKKFQRIRKVFGFSTKHIGPTLLQEIKQIRELLSDFDHHPERLIDRLQRFEKKQGLQSLQDTCAIHCMLNPEQTQASQFSLLRISRADGLGNPPQLKKQIIDTSHPPAGKQPFKGKITPTAGQPVTPATPEPPLAVDHTDLPRLFSDSQNDINNTISHWKDDADRQGIPYPAYINLTPNGLLGRLAQEEPVLTHNLLQERIKKLEEDIAQSFTHIKIPLVYKITPRAQALKAITHLKTLFSQIDLNAVSPDFTPCIDALEDYEQTFDKRSLQATLNIRFAGDVATTPYTDVVGKGRLEAPGRGEKKALASLYYQQYGDDVDILKAAIDWQNSPLIIAGKPLSSTALLGSALADAPESIRRLAKKKLNKKSPLQTTLKNLNWQRPRDRDELYRIITGHKSLSDEVKKQQIYRQILDNLVAFQPQCVLDMLYRSLSDQLAEDHHEQSARQMQTLIALSRSGADIKPLLIGFINHPDNQDLLHNIRLSCLNCYLEAISQRLDGVHNQLEQAPQKALLQALDHCETLLLTYDDALLDSQDGLNTHDKNDRIMTPNKIRKIRHSLEQEISWRFICKEQLKNDKDRMYFLGTLEKKEFLAKTADTSGLGARGRGQLEKWLPEWFSEKIQSPQTVLFEQVNRYLQQERVYLADPSHSHLATLQQCRFDLLDIQKSHVYTCALDKIKKNTPTPTLAGDSLEDHIQRLKAINRQQLSTAPSRPAQNIGGALWGTSQVLSGIGKTYDLDTMLDDIRWNQALLELGYDFNKEFQKRTGLSNLSYLQKFRQKLGLGGNPSAADQLEQASAAVKSTQDAVREQVEGFLNKALNNLSELKAIAQRHPKLFRNTFGTVIGILPAIAERLGHDGLLGNANLLNLQAQSFASAFAGSSIERHREQEPPLADHEKEWLVHLQFTHDLSSRLLYDLHRFDALKNVASYGLTGLSIGGLYGAMAGAGAGLYSAVSSAISPMASRAMLDKMPAHHLEYIHSLLSSNTAGAMGKMGETLGQIAKQAPNLMTNKSDSRRLFAMARAALNALAGPVRALRTQFYIIRRAYHDARMGKIGGWRNLALEILPVAIIVLGGLASASVAGLTIFFIWGVTAGLFAVGLSAFLSTSWKLSQGLLNENISERTPFQAFEEYREQLFNPDSAVAGVVRKRCQEEVERLAAGELFHHEAYLYLEQQELMRSYYENYWQEYCQQQAHKQGLDLEAVEKQDSEAFNRWIKTADIKKHARELSRQVQSLQLIDSYLASDRESTATAQLKQQLSRLGVVTALPDEHSPVFLRLARDELATKIELECGTVPNPEHIEAILKSRLKKAFLGYRVRDALSLAPGDHRDFLSKTRTFLRTKYCRKMARRAENQIKSLFHEHNDWPSPAPASPAAPTQPEQAVTEKALNEAMTEGLRAVTVEQEDACRKTHFAAFSPDGLMTVAATDSEGGDTADGEDDDDDVFHDALESLEENKPDPRISSLGPAELQPKSGHQWKPVIDILHKVARYLP